MLKPIIFLIFSLFAITCSAQNGKVINKQTHAWVSINSTARLSNKWGVILDVHERRNHFLKDDNFHFVRGAVNFWLKDNITFAAGYGHLWLAPTTDGWHTFSNENRMYQQAQITGKTGRISMLQRLRSEQRWQQKIVTDKPTGENKFSNRFRYLISFGIPLSSQPNTPSLVVADEICVQVGKEIVYNTFDQNRVFLGLKQNIAKSVSFDAGYMFVAQQKSSGIAYDHNNTFRLFFYYTPDLRNKDVR